MARAKRRAFAFESAGWKAGHSLDRAETPDPGSGVPALAEQLRAHLRRLRRLHQNVFGIGFGLRRSRGRVIPETTVRLIVIGKPPNGRRLPRTLRPLPPVLPLRVIVLGQVVTVQVPTDIENATRFRRTQFAMGSGCAAAYAAWTAPNGARAFGVVTAGHVLPALNTQVGIRAGPGGGIVTGIVVASSNLASQGVDVGLARLNPLPAGLLDVAPVSAPVLPAHSAWEWMGDDQDGRDLPARFWSASIGDALAAVAFYAEFPLDLGGGLVIGMHDVVECTGAANVFRPGRSGSLWGCQTPDNQLHTLAIQSHAATNGTRSVGTHLDRAVAWLRAELQAPDLTLRYKASDLV